MTRDEVGMSTAMQESMCPHAPKHTVTPHAEACERCGETENLRMCMECGFVGCCESHAGHNAEHYRLTGHAVIKVLPLERSWFVWCYACAKYA